MLPELLTKVKLIMKKIRNENRQQYEPLGRASSEVPLGLTTLMYVA